MTVQLQLLVRPYKQMIGLARYQDALQQVLARLGVDFKATEPRFPRLIRGAHRLLARFNYDLLTFLNTYPLAANLKENLPTHLTSQQMGILLWTRRRLHPCLVTVHDIVPYLVRGDQDQSTFRHPLDKLFDEAAMRGLKRADYLIADSAFTKKTVTEELAYPEDKVQVVPLAVDHKVFHPRPVPPSFFERFNLDRDQRHILYVGSENPRKNLPRLLEAFATVKPQLASVRLIKIGTVEYRDQARQLQEQVSALGLEGDVLFVNHVSDNDLALFYNAADLFVFPSLMEGFGLPPLEAMACGTPVVCANTASLPEVVGEAAVTVDPYDSNALAEVIGTVLDDVTLTGQLRAWGLERAKSFTWERTALETIKVYENVFGQEVIGTIHG